MKKKRDTKLVGIFFIMVAAVFIVFFIWKLGLINAAPYTGDKDPDGDGKPDPTTPVFVEATVKWKNIAWGSNLRIEDVQYNLNSPYSIGFKQMSILGGNIECRATLYDSSGKMVSKISKDTLGEMGGITGSNTKYAHFSFSKVPIGYTYKLKIRCIDTDNEENTAYKTIDIFTG